MAVSGTTTDGRKIERRDIEQMVANYDPIACGARVNLEHYRSILPDSPFRMYGDVLALKSEEVEILGQKELGLLAQIDPTSELVEMVNVKRQKVYSSIEIDPDFCGKGQSYLRGLACTDNPASLGTEMLKFCAGAGKNSPLTARKQRPENLFSEAMAVEIEFEDDTVTTSALEQFTSRIKQMLGGQKASNDGNFKVLSEAVELIADSQRACCRNLKRCRPARRRRTALSRKGLRTAQGGSRRLDQKLSESETGSRRSLATGAKDEADALDC